MTAKESKAVALEGCRECGMPCTPTEYHPYAACLMFRGCQNSATVRANLPDQSALHAAEAELGELRRKGNELARSWLLGVGKDHRRGCASQLQKLLASDGGADGDVSMSMFATKADYEAALASKADGGDVTAVSFDAWFANANPYVNSLANESNEKSRALRAAAREGWCAALNRHVKAAQPAPVVGGDWRDCYSRIIKALGSMVTVSTPDKLFDLDAIPRDPIMEQVVRIRQAVDSYGKTLLAARPGGEGRLPGCDAERREDMGTGRLRLTAQDDGDMCVLVIDDDGSSAGVEFCNSGGKSEHTLQALRDLSRAMKQDDAYAHPAQAGGGAE